MISASIRPSGPSRRIYIRLDRSGHQQCTVCIVDTLMRYAIGLPTDTSSGRDATPRSLALLICCHPVLAWEWLRRRPTKHFQALLLTERQCQWLGHHRQQTRFPHTHTPSFEPIRQAAQVLPRQGPFFLTIRAACSCCLC